MSQTTHEPSFFLRHEFLLRRLHSLTGIVPLGLYMCVHLTVNSSLLNSVETFQGAVYGIHSLGKFLPIVEWAGIFLPLLFHGLFGLWIAKNAKLNTKHYKYTSNRRYSLQRWTGVFALVYLLVHVLHFHGWFHFGPYLAVIEPLQMAQFKPYNAASTMMAAMNDFGGFVWPAFYLFGMLCCVYHLANGLWTAGITWGLWLTPPAQHRASLLTAAFGVGLAVVGTAAWWAAISADSNDIARAKVIEDRMYKSGLEAGYVPVSEKKRTQPDKISERFEVEENAAEEQAILDQAEQTEVQDLSQKE